LGFATLISGQYAPPVLLAPVYSPPNLHAPAPVYGPPSSAAAPPFTILLPPLTTGESSLVPPQFAPAASVAGAQAQAGPFAGFATSASSQSNVGPLSFAAPPLTHYGTPSFKK
jgi:hypothetical protein